MTYHDHFEIYRNMNHYAVYQRHIVFRSIILQKQTHRKRDVLWLPEGLGERELDEGSQKVQTFSYKINKY